VGLVDRHRILNLFEIFYDKAVDDIRNVLRNPRKCKKPKPKPKPKPCPCYILHIFHVVQLIMFTSFFYSSPAFTFILFSVVTLLPRHPLLSLSHCSQYSLRSFCSRFSVLSTFSHYFKLLLLPVLFPTV